MTWVDWRAGSDDWQYQEHEMARISTKTQQEGCVESKGATKESKSPARAKRRVPSKCQSLTAKGTQDCPPAQGLGEVVEWEIAL